MGVNFADRSPSAVARRLRVVYYYNNAQHSKRVGIGRFYCNGRSSLEGTSTQYSVEVVNEPFVEISPANFTNLSNNKGVFYVNN